MSSSTPTTTARTALLAAGGGVVALALLFGFAVGLPELTGDESGDAAGAAAAAPGELAPLPRDAAGRPAGA